MENQKIFNEYIKKLEKDDFEDVINFVIYTSNPFVKNIDGDNFLHIAVCHKHVQNRLKIMEFLLDFGFDINEKGQYEMTSLHCSTLRIDEKYMRLLLERGANINEKDEHGDTSLHNASMFTNVGCVKLLLEHDADNSIINKSRKLPHEVTKSKEIYELIKNFDYSIFSLKEPDL